MRSLFNEVSNDLNIYMSYYSLDTYIDGKTTDSKLFEEFEKIKNRHDFNSVNKLIKKVKERLTDIFKKNNFFTVNLRFEVKSVDEEDKIKYRALHQPENLVDLISMVAILNVFKFENITQGLQLSEVSKSIPDNFYGSIPSAEINQLYEPWKSQYGKYTEQYVKHLKEYQSNKVYNSEVNLDIKNFFPSINPKIIISKIITEYKMAYHDYEIKMALEKLFNLKINGNDKQDYYKNNTIDSEQLMELEEKSLSIGIPQGLPQSYFFANIIMIEISEICDNYLPGKALYYVDDSVRFVNADSDYKLEEKIEKINYDIKKMEERLLDDYNELFNTNMENHDNIYGISIHPYEPDKVNSKTSVSSISELGDLVVELYLPGLTRNIYFSDWELITSKQIESKLGVLSRLEALLKLVEKERKEKENIITLKKLNRIRKYLIYRLDINKYVLKNESIDIMSIIDALSNKSNKQKYEIIEEKLFLLKYKQFLSRSYDLKEIETVKLKMRELKLFDLFKIPEKFLKPIKFDDFQNIDSFLNIKAIHKYSFVYFNKNEK